MRYELHFIESAFRISSQTNTQVLVWFGRFASFAKYRNADSGTLKPCCQWSRTLTIEYSELQKVSFVYVS